MRMRRLSTSLCLGLLLASCGSQNEPLQSSVASTASESSGGGESASGVPAVTGDPEQALSDGLVGTLKNVAANGAGEVRQIEGPLFDDFEFGIAHAITMENRMDIGPSRTRILDLELLESDPQCAVALLRERLEAAGFRLNSSEINGPRRDWDYRRNDNEGNLQGLLVKISERPLRENRAPEHAGATARLGLTLSDSRRAPGR